MNECLSREQLESLLALGLADLEQSPLVTHLSHCTLCQERLDEAAGGAISCSSRRIPDVHDPAPEVLERLHRAVQGSTLPFETPESNAPILRPRIPGFEIEEEIGRGGMGVVYRAVQEGLNRTVALKMVRADHLREDQLDRFRQEAELVARLRHPNIIQIHQVGESEGLPYIALEYIEGGSLADHLQGMPQPPEDAAELIRTLAQAVQHAHDRGIIHRDLKPSNVLLGGQPVAYFTTPQGTAMPSPRFQEPKIADFGLARHLESPESRTHSGLIVGTPSYMAPEQARGDREEVGPPCDVWALGAILYELLTGRPPFAAPTVLETLALICHEDPVAPRRFQPGVPRDLETICLKALTREPGRRYPAAQALADDLLHFHRNEPILARPVGSLERGWRWCRRNPRLALASSLAFVFLVGGSVTSTILAVRANQARADAVRRSTQYRQALEDQTGLVMDRFLRQQAALTPEHRQFLHHALAQFEELAREQGNEEATRLGVARALHRVGGIRARLGETQDAEQAYQQAIEAFDLLADRLPGNPDLRHEQAAACHDLATLLYRAGRHDSARERYAAALDLRLNLLEAFPAEPRYRRGLAETHINLGILLVNTSHPDQAEREYLAALRTLRELGDEPANDPATQRIHASVHHELGDLFLRNGRHQQAEQAFRDAVGILARMAATYPSSPEYQHELANTHNSLAQMFRTIGRLGDAEKEYREAQGWQKKLVTTFPAVPGYRMSLAVSHQNLGTLLQSTGRPADAEKEYRTAIEFSHRLATDFPEIPSYRETEAQVRGNLGVLLRITGRTREAELEFQQNIALLKTLAKEMPRVTSYRALLATAHSNHGILLRTQGRPLEAEKEFVSGIDLIEKLSREFPAQPLYRQELAMFRGNLANVYQVTQRANEAVDENRTVLQLFEQLSREFPGVPEYREQRAATHNNLAAVLRRLGRLPEAEASFRDGAALSRALMAEFPSSQDHRQQLAGCLRNLALLLQDMKQIPQAEKELHTAVPLWRKLEADFPNVPRYRAELGVTLGALARLAVIRKDPLAARKLFEEGLEHEEAAWKAQPQQPDFSRNFRADLTHYAVNLLFLGDHAGVAAAAARLVKAGIDRPLDAYVAANLLAGCLPALEKDTKCSPEEKQVLAKTYGDQAMVYLRRAVESGFKDPEQLRRSRNLAPIRPRHDYQQLVIELEAKQRATSPATGQDRSGGPVR